MITAEHGAELGATARGYRVAGGITGYRARTFALVRSILQDVGHVPEAIDVGAGDGWAAKTLMQEGLVGHCQPLDVVRRHAVDIEPTLYDGWTLPLGDRSVSLAYAIDAAHHASDPIRFVRELARVSKRWVLLKDHTYRAPGGRLALRILDEIGNRRFSIGSPGNYQNGFRWFEALRADGFVLRNLVHPARCHTGLLGAATNRLQFIGLFESGAMNTHVDWQGASCSHANATSSSNPRAAPSRWQYDYLVLSLLHRDIVRALSFLRQDNVSPKVAIDVGAGGGPYRHLLGRHGYTVKTLDIAPGDGIDIVGSAEHTGLANDSVDLVLCTQVLRTYSNAMARNARVWSHPAAGWQRAHLGPACLVLPPASW